jgi:hypothetical protein
MIIVEQIGGIMIRLKYLRIVLPIIMLIAILYQKVGLLLGFIHIIMFIGILGMIGLLTYFFSSYVLKTKPRITYDYKFIIYIIIISSSWVFMVLYLWRTENHAIAAIGIAIPLLASILLSLVRKYTSKDSD